MKKMVHIILTALLYLTLKVMLLLLILQKYSLELERFAQDYVDVVEDCPLQHNPNNSRYGENVYLRRAYGNVDNTVYYKQIVTLWYNEEPYYNYYTNTCNPPPGKSCGHFTQVSMLYIRNTALLGQ